MQLEYPGTAYIAVKDPVNLSETGEKWSRVHLDYAGPITKVILVAVDSHYKCIEAIAIRNSIAGSTISSVRQMLRHFGIPRTVVTDNGAQFAAELFSLFLSPKRKEQTGTKYPKLTPFSSFMPLLPFSIPATV